MPSTAVSVFLWKRICVDILVEPGIGAVAGFSLSLKSAVTTIGRLQTKRDMQSYIARVNIIIS